VIAARGAEQKRLAERIPALGVTVEKQAADRLGRLRPAGLARSDGGDPTALERRQQEADLGRFASPLPAFDGDETAARRRTGGRAQCRLPQIR
jgi:hypothetical protein